MISFNLKIIPVTKKQEFKNLTVVFRVTRAGITLSVCGMSLNKFTIEKDELPQGVDVVPNGLIRMFDLQEKGYKTLAL